MEIKHISEILDDSIVNSFGLMPNGQLVDDFEFINKNGLKLKVITFGATITALEIPLKNEKIIDVVLGFDLLEDYINSFHLQSAPYFGATIGRFAGRIKKGTFNLNGETFILNKNNNNHSLHGGNSGFSQKIWNVKQINSDKNPSITLTYLSSDGEENFPGNLNVELKYTLSEQNELIVEYQAKSDKDTIINLTHHSYFNLDGHQGDITEQELFVNSQKMLETNLENIPTGRFNNVANCPFDFSIPKNYPQKIDNTFILDKKTELSASLYSKKNNLKMEVYTNQPAVHLYVGGNCFNKIKGKENVDYHSLSGICFETQNFPDSPNHNHFPNSILKENETYYHKTIYKFEIY